MGGDFYEDPLPQGADLAWLGAIIHQNSREQNRALLAKVYEALAPGGQVVIRDVIMDPSRTRPVMGALFAIMMLLATDAGGTYTFEEVSEDLSATGFIDATLVRRGEFMDSLIRATKPGQLPAINPVMHLRACADTQRDVSARDCWPVVHVSSGAAGACLCLSRFGLGAGCVGR